MYWSYPEKQPDRHTDSQTGMYNLPPYLRANKFSLNTQNQTNPAKFSSTECRSECASNMFPVIISKSCQHVPQWISNIHRHLISTTVVTVFIENTKIPTNWIQQDSVSPKICSQATTAQAGIFNHTVLTSSLDDIQAGSYPNAINAKRLYRTHLDARLKMSSGCIVLSFIWAQPCQTMLKLVSL